MDRLTRFARRLALCLAFLQFGLQGVFAVADGYAEAEGQHSYAHVESQSSHCPRVHTDDCSICQFLANGVGPLAPTSPGLLPVVEHFQVAPTEAPKLKTAAAHPSARPRAPPVA